MAYISNQYIILCRPMCWLYWILPCIFILFSQMLTDNRLLVATESSQLQQPWWLHWLRWSHSVIPLLGWDLFAAKRVTTLLWMRRFYGGDPVAQPARASSHGWPVGAVSQPTPARGRIPSLGRIIIIASYKMLKWKRPTASISLTKRAKINLTEERDKRPRSMS